MDLIYKMACRNKIIVVRGVLLWFLHINAILNIDNNVKNEKCLIRYL